MVYDDPDHQDRVEELADGSYIAVPEIPKAKAGLPFRYFPEGETKSAECPGVDDQAYYHYMTIFNYSELWGLPHGNGWGGELPWVLEFLAQMKSYKRTIEEWHHRRAIGNG